MNLRSPYIVAIFFIIVYSGVGVIKDYLPERVADYIVIIEAAITTILVMVLVTAYQRGRDLNKMSDRIADTVSSRIKPEIDEVIESLVPGTKKFGLSGAGSEFDFREIFENLDPNDQVDIFFTYHPQMESELQAQLNKLKKKQISIRLLVGYHSSLEIIRRFHQIVEGSDDRLWASDDTLGGSMRHSLKAFTNQKLKLIVREHSQRYDNGRQLLSYKVFEGLPDHPIVVVRNEDEDNAIYHIKYALIGFYLNPPAVEMPAVKWTPISKEKNSVAVAAMNYFRTRWSQAKDIDDMEAYYASGQAWLDKFSRLKIPSATAMDWLRKS